MIEDHTPAPTPEATADPSTTGDARVDNATSALGELDALPVGEHVEHYADVHSKLQDILNEVGSPTSRVD